MPNQFLKDSNHYDISKLKINNKIIDEMYQDSSFQESIENNSFNLKSKTEKIEISSYSTLKKKYQTKIITF